MTSLVTESRVDDIVVDQPPAPTKKARRLFPWVVFALTFGLLLSDYMSRQVLSAVFPFLKLEWALTDTQLGGLISVVALTVGRAGRPAVPARRPLGPGQVDRPDGRRSGAWPPSARRSRPTTSS